LFSEKYDLRAKTRTSQPVTLLFKGDQTKAYLANLGSGTVSEIHRRWD
jgi:hypothetical protein